MGLRATSSWAFRGSAPLAKQVVFNSAITYQTWKGLQLTAQAGQDISDVGAANFCFSDYSGSIFTKAVNELGVTELRIGVRFGAEDTTATWLTAHNAGTPYSSSSAYSPTNDNADPNVLNAAGFHFDEVDFTMTQVVLPMRDACTAAGKTLRTSLCMTDRIRTTTLGNFLHATSAAEYAEFVLACVDHLYTTHSNFLPDTLEAILEPDNNQSTGWRIDGTYIGQCIVAANARLVAAGYTGIKWIGPSNTDPGAAAAYATQMLAVSGVPALMEMIAYHPYGGTTSQDRTDLNTISASSGLPLGQMEFDSGFQSRMVEDLTLLNCVRVHPYTICYPSATNIETSTGVAYWVDMGTGVGIPRPTNEGKLMGQLFPFIGDGSVRVAATAVGGSFEPVAFVNPTTNHPVVFIKTASAETVSVTGLPDGLYGVRRTERLTANYWIDAADMRVAGGNHIDVSTTADGAVTVYRKSA